MPDATAPVSSASPTQQYPHWWLPALGVAVECVFIVGMAMAYRLQDATLFNVALGAAIVDKAKRNNIGQKLRFA